MEGENKGIFHEQEDNLNYSIFILKKLEFLQKIGLSKSDRWLGLCSSWWKGCSSLHRVYPLVPAADAAECWPQDNHLPSFLVHA